MSRLDGKRILVGVTGGIAAYKSAELVRLLGKQGAEVRVVMTAAAGEFITPMTLQALSGYPVRQSLFDQAHEAAMGHIELARWADLILIAPASADFMARLAQGMADDLLTTLCLARTVPLAIAPAMNQAMWANPATQANLATLQSRGIDCWGPDAGSQACGEVGPGRMLEPEAQTELVIARLSAGPLQGVKVLLTAGPTREPIDPVRYVGNRSSGKMGFSLARALREAGADVSLVSGPVSLATPAGVKRTDVETALQMRQAVLEQVVECDIFVACAAVADYRPREVAGQKIKKQQEQLEIRLERNPDILAEVAALESPPFTVGFAAETDKPIEYAQQKRKNKRVNMVAANLVGAEQGGFERDENALTVVWEGGQQALPMSDKGELAKRLVELIVEQYEQNN
ncbi:MAG: bifunctional phosphopantothenoylcysteine decarboxylase/phosphopantothenate--cysteine ligase CoaBC [Chromatiales bacterium]|nr:bifunctional phosphopantothenoylcysteine decarboxylase/phosphopantothenate--cysteine ligase CoaBC [Chromatiales bacterium]